MGFHVLSPYCWVLFCIDFHIITALGGSDGLYPLPLMIMMRNKCYGGRVMIVGQCQLMFALQLTDWWLRPVTDWSSSRRRPQSQFVFALRFLFYFFKVNLYLRSDLFCIFSKSVCICAQISFAFLLVFCTSSTLTHYTLHSLHIKFISLRRQWFWISSSDWEEKV